MDLADLKAMFTTTDSRTGAAGVRHRLRVCADSRDVAEGDIFVAVRGPNQDGHDFVHAAVERGAAYVVTEDALALPEGVVGITVNNSAQALGGLAQWAAGSPAEQLDLLGVTGTNGKTTVAYMVRTMLARAQRRCGLIGTVEYDDGAATMHADNTTPGSVRLAEIMAAMVDNGLDSAVMECSSHGLDQNRTAGLDFRAAAFTNLTGDHIDYHGSMEAYRGAKGRLFASLRDGAVAILNRQDTAAAYMAEHTGADVWWYGINGTTGADISATILQMDLRGCRVRLRALSDDVELALPLLGEHNVSNLLAATGLALAAGVALPEIAAAAEHFMGVPGRLERVDCGQDATVLVDYAHTDDALENVLKAVRALKPRRLLVVFGCGGDRDRSKRPRMAAAAAKWADYVVVTDDNPRTEDRQQIFDDIRTGFTDDDWGRRVELRPDRREAITRAIEWAGADDVVLIAGKGHEDYQIVGEQRLHFDDREAAREALQTMSFQDQG